MSSNHPLQKFLRVSLAKKTNKKLFVSLLEQLLAREPVTDSELGEVLLDISENATKTILQTRKSMEITRFEYAVEFAVSNSENLARFFKLLPQLRHQCQYKYMSFLKGRISQIIGRPLAEEFLERLIEYTSNLDAQISSSSLEKNQALKRLWYNVVFLWGALADTSPSLLSQSKFKDMCAGMSKIARGSGDANISSFISRKFGSLVDAAFLSPPQEQDMIKSEALLGGKPGKVSSLSFSSKKYTNYVLLKKFIWLNTHFRSWKINPDLVRKFTVFFDLQEMSHQDLAKELIVSFFSGFVISVKSKTEPYVIFNWKNFILTQLVYDVKSLESLSSPEYQSTITSAVSSFKDSVIIKSKVGGTNDAYDLGKEFLRACVYQKVISLDEFVKTYPSESENLSASLIAHEVEKLDQTDVLVADFNSKLESVNTEFTSLEESNLIEYFHKLLSSNFRLSKVKQEKLAELMENLIDNLIREKNNEKLSWVALVFSNVPAIANYIFYRSRNGPWMFLNKVISYIDNETFDVDEDEGNFQEVYARFGVMLTGVISVSVFFGIDFSSVSIKGSYTIDFINGFYFRSCDSLAGSYSSVNEQEKQIIANYENLFKEWANALFDVNNDGLSDDLLKSVNVKQIYKFIFLLFRQAFTARAMGIMSENSLNNGIDYLSQNFLAPCSLEAMSWVASRIGPRQKNNDTMVEIMLRIIEGNTGASVSSESSQNFTFRMILNTISPSLLTRLKTFSGKHITQNIAKLTDILSRETDPEYCQRVIGINKSMTTSVPRTKTITADIIKDGAKGIDGVSEMWMELNTIWHISRTDEAFYTFLKEIDQTLSTKSAQALEESKVVVDFFSFMFACSGYADSEDLAFYTTQLETGKILNLSAHESEKEFNLTINDHVSSIFNENVSADEVSPKEDKSRPREELMGDFEMGDLFDDMSENFFDEPMTSFSKSNNPVADSADTKALFNPEAVYKQLHGQLASLCEVAQLLVAPQYTNCSQLTDIARTKILDELKKWRSAHRY